VYTNAFEFWPPDFDAGEILPPPNFPQSDLGRRADSRWALPQISRLFMFCYKLFFQREISELRGPTGMKFCTMVSTRPSFKMPVKILGDTPHRNFGGEKHAKFSSISDDFEVRRRISETDEDIQNQIFTLSTAIPPMLGETSSVNFSPVTLEISM